MIRSTGTTAGRPAGDGRAASTTVGLLYVLGVPLAAGVATVEGLGIGGLNYTGFLWVFFLLGGIVLVVEELLRPGGTRIAFPVRPWLVWVGYLGLSLAWCEPLTARNVQGALQVGMPVVVGVAASVFVRTEEQLDRLLRTFAPAAALLVVSPVAEWVGLLGALGMSATPRSLALTAALAGCVFMARFPDRFLGPLVGWGWCILLTVVTGGRMATLVLLLVPALHPLYRTRWWRPAVLVTTAALGLGVFYTPIFQKRFFHEGQGTLGDVVDGQFLSFGRFEVWPDIWEESWRHPYLGHGIGTAHDYVPTVWEDMKHIHNDYLRVFFELGFVGVAIFLFVLAWQLAAVWRRIKRSDGVVRVAFGVVWLGLWVFAISAVTDNPLGYNVWYMDPLFAVLGAAYGVAAHQTQAGPPPHPAAATRHPGRPRTARARRQRRRETAGR